MVVGGCGLRRNAATPGMRSWSFTLCAFPTPSLGGLATPRVPVQYVRSCEPSALRWTGVVRRTCRAASRPDTVYPHVLHTHILRNTRSLPAALRGLLTCCTVLYKPYRAVRCRTGSAPSATTTTGWSAPCPFWPCTRGPSWRTLSPSRARATRHNRWTTTSGVFCVTNNDSVQLG